MKPKTGREGHTPGPWAIRTSHKGGWKVVGPDFRDGAGMSSVAHTDYAYIDPVEQANARLIAAAPDLLEAAKECYGFGAWAHAIGNKPLADALHKLRSAIQKASGEGA